MFSFGACVHSAPITPHQEALLTLLRWLKNVSFTPQYQPHRWGLNHSDVMRPAALIIQLTKTSGHIFTSFTGARPVASAGTVTDESVPAFLTDTSILAGVAFTLFARLLGTRRFDASAILCLSDLTYVLTSAVNEKVTDAADIAVVEHGRPELGR